mmetsp:Transcript_55154/g.129083  ORF Transcript_55154/g.129083 Transcript_55154/m.129083 type:complete len:341 (-) Transcript_55154:499-1521(-)
MSLSYGSSSSLTPSLPSPSLLWSGSARCFISCCSSTPTNTELTCALSGGAGSSTTPGISICGCSWRQNLRAGSPSSAPPPFAASLNSLNSLSGGSALTLTSDAVSACGAIATTSPSTATSRTPSTASSRPGSAPGVALGALGAVSPLAVLWSGPNSSTWPSELGAEEPPPEGAEESSPDSARHPFSSDLSKRRQFSGSAARRSGRTTMMSFWFMLSAVGASLPPYAGSVTDAELLIPPTVGSSLSGGLSDRSLGSCSPMLCPAPEGPMASHAFLPPPSRLFAVILATTMAEDIAAEAAARFFSCSRIAAATLCRLCSTPRSASCSAWPSRSNVGARSSRR